MDNLKLQELVRQEAGDLFDVCDGLPIGCKQAVTLAMVHVAKAVEESIALNGIDRIADRPLRDAEAQLLKISDWLYRHADQLSGIYELGPTAAMVVSTLDYLWRELQVKDIAYTERVIELQGMTARLQDLQRQLDAAHAAPKALNVTIAPGLPGTWNPNTEVR